MILVLTLVLVPAISSAEMSAGRLARDLDLVDVQDLAAEQGMRFLLAAGYLQGAAEMGNQTLFCLPQNFTNAQLVGVVRDLLHQTPERAQESAATLVREALASTFPCASEQR
jgi:hypothetical protein